MERRPRASPEGAGGRRLQGVRRAGRWLGLGVGALCLVAVVVVDTGAVGFFASGGDGGRLGGFLAPVSARSAGAGVIAASSHIRPDGSCRYGRWSTGNCRACPSGQVWRTGQGCIRAASSTSCSSGNSYFSQWRGCRASSCPHGRTNSGYCQPAPTTTRAAATTSPTTTTTTRAVTTTTTRPVTTTAATTTTTTTTTTTAAASSCGDNRRRPDGTCRACEKLDEYHNGSMCVKKEANAPGEEACRIAGQVRFSSYGGCRPASCQHGRDSRGFCNSPPLVVPTVPVGVEANGDSRSLYRYRQIPNPVNGKILVSWTAVPNANSYVVSYALDATTLSWREQSTTGTSISLLGTSPEFINLNYLYHIRVKAVNNDGESSWSKTVYSYPTFAPITQGHSVGIIPIVGYRSDASYDYILCTNTGPTQDRLDELSPDNPALLRDLWMNEIISGIEIWDSTVDLITVNSNLDNPEIRRCSDQELNRNTDNNYVGLIDYNNIASFCKSIVACARSTNLSGGKRTKTSIYIRNDYSLLPSACSHIFKLATHESGHAFGLGDHKIRNISVMYNRGVGNFCSPTEYDIGAMKAIYQSRSTSTDRVSTSTSTTMATNFDTTIPTTNSPPTSTTTTSTTSTTTTTTTAATTTTTVAPTTTTVPTTTTTTTAATTTTASQPVTLWQIEARPTTYTTNDIEWHLTSGNTFTYAGRTYTIDRIKTHRLGARIQATPDLEDHELPDRTQIRFWPTDTPASVQTLRLGDAIVMPADHPWDLIWGRRRYPIDINRNTTWHIDITIPSASSP